MIRKILMSAVLGMTALAASSQSSAQDDIIGKRKGIMGDNNRDVKAIAAAVKKKDYATIQVKAKEIVSGLETAASLFPKGSDKGKTRAHPDIWAKPDEFKKDLANAVKVAEALSKAAEAQNEAEVAVKVKELGSLRTGACGECHKVFRADMRKDG